MNVKIISIFLHRCLHIDFFQKKVARNIVRATIKTTIIERLLNE